MANSDLTDALSEVLACFFWVRLLRVLLNFRSQAVDLISLSQDEKYSIKWIMGSSWAAVTKAATDFFTSYHCLKAPAILWRVLASQLHVWPESLDH